MNNLSRNAVCAASVIVALLFYMAFTPSASYAGESGKAEIQKWHPDNSIPKDDNTLVYVLGGLAVAAVIVGVIILSNNGSKPDSVNAQVDSTDLHSSLYRVEKPAITQSDVVTQSEVSYDVIQSDSKPEKVGLMGMTCFLHRRNASTF